MPPDFWGGFKDLVSNDKKEWIYEQYFDRDTLRVYCDCSNSIEKNAMSVACSYVINASILVENQYVYMSPDLMKRSIAGEIKAVMFALNNFQKHIGKAKNAIIYTDMYQIEGMLNDRIKSKRNIEYSELQLELFSLYDRVIVQAPQFNISIRTLAREDQAHNPFYKSAHNASKKKLFG